MLPAWRASASMDTRVQAHVAGKPMNPSRVTRPGCLPLRRVVPPGPSHAWAGTIPLGGGRLLTQKMALGLRVTPNPPVKLNALPIL